MKRNIINLLITILTCLLFFACSKGTYTDPRDGKTYKTVKIGEQIWFAENFKFEKTKYDCPMPKTDGGRISYSRSDLTLFCEKYGKLYDFETAVSSAPPGWHLPTAAEWIALIDSFGSDSVAHKELISSGNSGFNVLFSNDLCDDYWTASHYDGNTGSSRAVSLSIYKSKGF